MPTYKYQAVLSSGVSVFGIFDAENETGLASYLLTRNMTLVDFSELAIDKSLSTPLAEIPRMLQLRIGERVQEALLTGLPAHVAIAAMADEPFEHPLLMAMPWLTGMAGCSFMLALLLNLAIPEFAGPLMLSGTLAVITCGLLWIVAHWWLQVRPKRMLLRLAGRLAAGSSEPLIQEEFLPAEIRSIISSGMTTSQKSLSVAELLQSLGLMQVQRHLFATRMVAPLLALLLLFLAGYFVLLIVVPQFSEIFIDFGMELPDVTIFIVNLSNFIRMLGTAGLISVVLLTTAIAVTIYSMIVWPSGAEILSVVPLLGTSLRLLMQARVARVLGVLVRNQASVPDAIAVATDASGFREVRNRGREIAADMLSGKPMDLVSKGLHGLPLSLLLRVREQNESEQARQETAQSYMMFASSLEQASWGHGSILATGIEILAIGIAGLVIFVFVISMFLPLIRLLKDLAVCCWTTGAWL